MSTRTEIQRMGRLLSRRLEETDISADEGVSVEDLSRRLLPYHLCRTELGLTTKAEYDILMLELIGESGYLGTDEPKLASAVSRERASPEPGLAFLRGFAASRLRLLDNRVEDLTESLPEPEPAARSPERLRPGTGSLSAKVRSTHPRRSATTGCWSCAEALPDRRGLRYCPHCGVDQTTRPCRSCDAELEHGWAYCPVCGEPATGRR